MKTIAIILAVTFALSGCATNMLASTRDVSSNIIVDEKGIDVDKYYTDLLECQAYASHVDVQANTGSAALAGGLFGALIGGMAGNRNTAGIIGLLGAAEAAGQANQQSSNTVQKIMRECLRGRGYRVLN